MLNLEQVADVRGREDLIGFVFLSLPPDLRQHAGQVAEERLISDFVNRKVLEPGDIVPGPARFFEYLTAVDDLQHLHAALKQQVQELARKTRRAKMLFASSTLQSYVLHWDLCWPFLGWLNVQRDRLCLDSCLTVVFCRPKMPFWSLMDRFVRFRGARQDLYFDAAGGSIVMFTAKEVNTIRHLANEARKAWVGNTELESLVAMALNTEVHELHLEIEARGSERKLGSRAGFPGKLRKALDELVYESDDGPQQRRQKRAVFIKYVKKLKGGR
jgi:hypothetical protein